MFQEGPGQTDVNRIENLALAVNDIVVSEVSNTDIRRLTTRSRRCGIVDEDIVDWTHVFNFEKMFHRPNGRFKYQHCSRSAIIKRVCDRSCLIAMLKPETRNLKPRGATSGLRTMRLREL